MDCTIADPLLQTPAIHIWIIYNCFGLQVGFEHTRAYTHFNSLQCLFYGFWCHTHNSQIYSPVTYYVTILMELSVWLQLLETPSSQGFIWPAKLSLNSASFQHWRSFSLSICKETLLFVLFGTPMHKSMQQKPAHWNLHYCTEMYIYNLVWKEITHGRRIIPTRFTTLGIARLFRPF